MELDILFDYCTPINTYEISNDEDYVKGQIGQIIRDNNNIETADVIIIGADEWRGSLKRNTINSANKIREQFYKMYFWHTEVKIADAGNIKIGETLADTISAIKTVCAEFYLNNKKVILLGGSHDLMMGQYKAFCKINKLIEASVVDALMDIDNQNPVQDESFLYDMLTAEPNYVKHYNHIGFQSYFVHPNLLESIDKLRFDCYRVGKIKENIEDIEPIIRSTNLLGFDINAIANAFAPANRLSPNGLDGAEACKILQYCGMSDAMQAIGIFGYQPQHDIENLTAIQISQMLWYYIDGVQRQKHEAPLSEKHLFNEYHTICAEVDTVFLQSKNTGRWWLQMPDSSFIPCSYKDYITASENDIPERWLKVQERM